jgi:hypothetical protein
VGRVVALLAIAALAAAALGLMLVSGALEPEAPKSAGAAHRRPWTTPAPAATSFDRGENALWLRRQWLYAGVSVDEVDTLAKNLAVAGVTRVYPFLGPMDAKGVPGWRGESGRIAWQPEQAAAFLGRMKAAHPEIAVLPWTGAVVGRDLKFGDDAQLAAFTSELKKVLDAGARGIHLDFEPVADADPGLLQLVRNLKASLGPDKELSIAAVAPRHERIPVQGARYWSMDYLSALCGTVDEIVIMAYDTWLDDADVYQRVMADWTHGLATELKGPCAWRIGVPTYDDDGRHHRLDVERIDIALRGVRAGFERSAPPPGFKGVALYASWTTDAQEWAAYDALWRGRSPTAQVLPEPTR